MSSVFRRCSNSQQIAAVEDSSCSVLYSSIFAQNQAETLATVSGGSIVAPAAVQDVVD